MSNCCEEGLHPGNMCVRVCFVLVGTLPQPEEASDLIGFSPAASHHIKGFNLTLSAQSHTLCAWGALGYVMCSGAGGWGRG